MGVTCQAVIFVFLISYYQFKISFPWYPLVQCTYVFSHEPSKVWTTTCQFWCCSAFHATLNSQRDWRCAFVIFTDWLCQSSPSLFGVRHWRLPSRGVFHNSLTHFIKSLHLNGGKDCNVVPADEKRNFPSFYFFVAYLISAVCVRPLSHGRRQADNLFPPIPAAVRRDRFLRWQRWFVFAARADPVVEAVESRVLNISL